MISSAIPTRRLGAVVAVLGMLALLSPLVSATPSAASTAATTAIASSAVTKDVTATRTNLLDGNEVPVDTRKVSLTVASTTDLRDQQSIAVSWTGAHPSSNSSPDPNSDTGYQAEYPMVLLQCRGVDSATAPVAQQLTPQTCWSPFYGSRSQLNGQGGDSRNIDVGNYPAWRLDRYADLGDRRQFSREPATISTLCPNLNNAAEHRLPFRAADGKVYYGAGNFADTFCGPPPPEAASFTGGNSSASNLPDNATFAATDVDGSGTASFNVRDALTNASLGCSSTVACSLVAIPVMGISCDAGTGLPAADRPVGTEDNPDLPALAEAECEQRNFFAPGSLHVDNPPENYAVSGGLWWSASNWRNRISVPLHFAPPSNVCDLVSKKVPVNIYGSELLIQATTQWSAQFCLDQRRAPFRHVQYSDAQARNLLTQSLSSNSQPEGRVEAIFDSYPPTGPYPTPVVHAPVAATGFAISYSIDDKAKHTYTQLKLTPRLLAKLLTESYPVRTDLQELYSYDAPYYGKQDPLRHNPLNITFDPEFIALNPGIESNSSLDTGARGALLSVGSNADVVRALTSYVNADPEARAWLDGAPDPWGMVVNPNYRGISLPVDTMPLLDTYAFPDKYGADGTCTANVAPVPYLPLVAAPISRLADIAQAVQYAVPGSQTRCALSIDPAGNTFYQWSRAQRQSVGFRFVVGVTSLGDARRYGLATAALQSSSTITDHAAKFSTAAGRQFVQPTMSSLRSAAALLTFAGDAAGWPIPYDTLRTAAGSAAYPGTMLVYLDVAATGLPSADAAAYAALLTYLAGPGQSPGEGSGQLPDGYLPLTAANGLGSLAAYTAKAAGIVAAQGRTAGRSPVSVPGHPPAGQPQHAGPAGGSSPSGPPHASGAGKPTPASTPAGSSAPKLQSLGKTTGLSSSISENLLWVLLVLLLLGPVLAPITLVVVRRRGGR
ncbi:MAG: hypothetical protein M3Y42_18475 [Actinomycetota bacterium]|nr:hypothetical protein [Actinomycetota bacterium]MDQ2958930.1 hypothetical protein [Actinomycetota bacterium]